ncbi:hypothetical protein M378DRAFT_16053 [Amanita muscaria Koide BX008]|uniref:Uncharacterized protein n=1 Tax=Amanita muscaria (strain Koide BX008) TaxID=946122 RepID=A0A0C2SUL0_AMAMK|nr:hypothetical protein M378DRAFT_16053 [Amanita muscaria Koide BX008]
MVDEQNPLEEVTGRRVKKTLVTCHSDIQKEILKEEYGSPVVNKNSHNHTPKDVEPKAGRWDRICLGRQTKPHLPDRSLTFMQGKKSALDTRVTTGGSIHQIIPRSGLEYLEEAQ